MSPCVEDVSFQGLIERRRPIREILPTEINNSTTQNEIWLKAACWILAVSLLISVPLYVKYQTTQQTPAILRLSLEAAPLYVWYGFHRVAPDETSFD
jgi:hypothetical protein